MKRRVVFFVTFCLTVLLGTELFAQHASNLRWSTRTLDSVFIKLDTLSIVPGTFQVSGLLPSDYKLDYLSSELSLTDSSLVGKSVTFSYRVFQVNYSAPVAHKSQSQIMSRWIKDPTERDLVTLSLPSDNRIFDSSLQGNGSISRDFSVGSNQNFVLDANMNLQLSGFIAPDVEIVANITDENLPIQPDGNTRYIKDFNKVFLQLKYKDKIAVQAGDIEMQKLTAPYFFKVERQFKGLEFTINSVLDTFNRMTNTVGGGLSKGKFVRNQVTPIRGVQGPYRLTGAQGETNIVVLSGTEQVYLDGILLTRGQDNDYTIDYNVGEITFTAKHLITESNRIIVLFEYSDQYYSRYNLFTHNEFNHEKNDKLHLGLYFFHEQDLKRSSIQPELTDEQMMFLSSSGNVASADYPSAALAQDYSSNEILYHRVDTVVSNVSYFPVYVYAGAQRDSVYRVSFSYVGSNKGNYVLLQNAANGKVYQWVSPVNGIPQGDYEPVIRLNTPKMNDLLAVSASYQLSDKLTAATEIAFSYADSNLFSKQGNANNAGLAYKLQLDYQTKLHRMKDSLWKYGFKVDYEFVHKNFTPLETFRDIEFYREYNLDEDYSSETSEQIVGFSTGIKHPKKGSTYYSLNWLARFGNRTSIRNELASKHNINGWKWSSVTSYLIDNQNEQNSRFVKTVNDFSKSFSKIKLGVKDYLEYNVFRVPYSDTLRSNSYAFNEAAIYLTNSDTVSGYEYLFQYKNRVDDNTYNNILSLNTIANEVQATFAVTKWRHNRLKGTFTYRNDQVRDTLRNFVSEHNFVGNLDYSGTFWKGAVVLGLYYEAGSGLEQKKEYTFLKVAAGQGSYVWNDYNGNGIEELNEFELAAFQSEANYVKVWLSTNEYVNTYNCGATQTLQLRPANVWRNRKGFLKALSLFSNATSLRTYQKSTLQGDVRSLNPFQFNLSDSVLVGRTFNFKNNFSFALPSSYFALDYVAVRNQSKNLLYYGFESTDLQLHQIALRSVPTKLLILRTSYDYSVKQNQSQGFSSRDYRILSHSLEQLVTLHFKFDLEITLKGIASYKKNLLYGEKSNQYDASLDVNYRMKQLGSLSAELHYINVLYSGVADNSLSYEMLNGLSVGNNLLWNLSYQTKLFEYLQLSLRYEGRLTNESKAIHTGYLQLKAFF